MTGAAHRVTRLPRWALIPLLAVVLAMLVSTVGARVAVAGSRAALSVDPAGIGRQHLDVTFPSEVDGIPLSGWLFRSAHPTGRSLVLVHGWQGNRTDPGFPELARAMLARGYDVLMFDLRGSGRSGGSNQTFAALEPRDVLGARDFLVRRGYRPALMTILGHSMGGAAVIEAAPRLGDVGALVADSAYADLTSTLLHGLTVDTGLPGVVAWPALQMSRAFGVDPAVSPQAVVRSLPGRAFLFIHSRGDELLPVSNLQALGAASANPDTRSLLIDGTHHVDTVTHDPKRYVDALQAFVDRQVSVRRVVSPVAAA